MNVFWRPSFGTYISETPQTSYFIATTSISGDILQYLTSHIHIPNTTVTNLRWGLISYRQFLMALWPIRNRSVPVCDYDIRSTLLSCTRFGNRKRNKQLHCLKTKDSQLIQPLSFLCFFLQFAAASTCAFIHNYACTRTHTIEYQVQVTTLRP